MKSTVAHRILLVEDDLAWAELTREAFFDVAPDVDVEIVHDGAEAIARLSSGETPDVVLLDLNMPGTDGREVMRTIRSLPHADDLRVMILSASVSARDRALAGELGVDAYANKPTTFSALCQLAGAIVRGTLDEGGEPRGATPAVVRPPKAKRAAPVAALLGDIDLDVAMGLAEAGVDIVPAPEREELERAAPDADCVVVAGGEVDAEMHECVRYVVEELRLPVVVALRHPPKEPSPVWSALEVVAVVDITATGEESLGSSLRLAIERVRSAHQIAGDRSLFQAVLESLDTGVVACDRNGVIRIRNAAASLFSGFSPDGPSAHIVAVDDAGETSPIDESILHRALAGAAIGPVEIEGVDDEQTRRRWVVEAHRLMDADRRTIGAVALCREVTEQHRAERVLAHRADHDPLTGLANRAHAFERLQAALDRGARWGRRTAVLFIDVDHFKSVNDSVGHSGGDTVLQTVGLRLEHALRTGDMVARLGGDEFVIISELPDRGTAEGLATRLHETVSRPITVGGSVLTPTVSIGIVLVEGVADAHEVLDEADAAMYQAKRLGRARSYLLTRESPAEGA